MDEPIIERRKNHHSGELLELVRQIHDSQLAQAQCMNALDKKLADHITLEPVKLGEEIAELMAKAFPFKDPDGHRRYHELVIQRAEERAEFWKRMRIEVSKWGLLGVLGFLAAAAWNSFLQGPHK